MATHIPEPGKKKKKKKFRPFDQDQQPGVQKAQNTGDDADGDAEEETEETDAQDVESVENDPVEDLPEANENEAEASIPEEDEGDVTAQFDVIPSDSGGFSDDDCPDANVEPVETPHQESFAPLPKSLDDEDYASKPRGTRAPEEDVADTRQLLDTAVESLQANLQVLSDYGVLTVQEFRDRAHLDQDPKAAIRYLSRYVEQGLVSRSWQDAKGRYTLTPAGQQRLTELNA